MMKAEDGVANGDIAVRTAQEKVAACLMAARIAAAMFVMARAGVVPELAAHGAPLLILPT
jgi:UDP-N-acetylglucosamine:LPS N-acetylglucosamine transferase